MSFSHSNLRATFGATTFARGLQYFTNRCVLALSIEEFGDETIIQASTAGSGHAIYEQHVTIEGSGISLFIDGDCSCPVGYNCKHVAAACLAFAHETGAAPPAVNALDPFTHWLQRMSDAGAASPAVNEELVVYLLKPDSSLHTGSAVRIETRVVKPRANGRGLTRGRTIHIESMGYGARAFSDLDRDICSLLLAGGGYWRNPTLVGRAGYHAVAALLESERCYWIDSNAAPLTAGPVRKLELAWQSPHDDGDIELASGIAGGGFVLPTTPPLYLDPDQHVIGKLDSAGLSAAQIALLGAAPRVARQHAAGAAQVLAMRFAQLPMPLPAQVTTRDNSAQVLQPCLRLYGGGGAGGGDEAWLILDFVYEPDRIHALPSAPSSVLTADGEFVRVQRDPAAEGHAHARLRALGFLTAVAAAYGEPATRAVYVRGETDTLSWASGWSQFLRTELPQLGDQGWQIEHDSSFDLHFESGTWSADITDDDSDSDWFSLGFRLDFAGTSLPLLDVLEPVLNADWSALPETVAVPVGARRFVEVPSARLRPLLDTLRALFGERSAARDDHGMRLSRYEAGLLTDLENQGFALEGGKRWRQLAQKLNDFDGIRAVPVPTDLIATLRPYQQRGLDWLQFLCEYGFNGVLADDMGLGKTVQTLAHLLVEKGAGRLDRPALLVAPTSLMGNWQREAARFAPTLKVALLHGVDRGARYVDAAAADLLLTTYPLLPRDAERLGAFEFHSVILDEAQNVKNPRAKAAQVLRRLKTRHRLCLTGTPLENHLGELWALFDFLMPGFLGERDAFRRVYRTPIEQHGDSARQVLLARRISPFMLRRSKQEVAADLPPKTEMVQPIELGAAQAELYESIRASMDKRVREAIVRQGLARSHITILDALLKLRQVCCDPRLLKLQTGNSAPPSAKLEFLLDLLEELLAEGRKILLFSQFTSMLKLIEDELARRSIDYVKLTGQTRKRDEAIDRFRGGEVPLFVISLKAGGVGLNLPEADTVIHYDPWWNPAVEAQATDRAHRIGQTHPVFVYKLIVANSVEARMLELQDRKRALAAGIYAGQSGASGLEFDASALASLLAPIEHDVPPVNERPPARPR